MMNAQTLLVWLKNAASQPQARDLSTENLNTYNQMVTRSIVSVEMLDAGTQKIQADRSLSDTGKTSAIGALATSMLREVEFLGRSLSVLETSLANTDLFTVKPVVTDPLRREIRNAEIRDGVRGLTEPERDNQFLQAAQQDRTEVLDAMLDAPGGMLCSADRKTRALEERAKRRQPEAYAHWTQDVLFHHLVGDVRNLVSNTFVSLGVDPQKVISVLGAASDQTDEQAK